MLIVKRGKPEDGMGHSQAEKAQSREKILSIASRQVREGGLASISIGELMKAANLTHGGFYGHFASRDALIAAALERALSDGQTSSRQAKGPHGKRTLKTILNNYLSRPHRDASGSGCGVAALAGDVARSGTNAKKIITPFISGYFESVQSALDQHDLSDEAISIVCLMIGAMILSRAVADPSLSDQILQASRRTALELGGHQ